MHVELVYSPAMNAYRFSAAHPLRPERFSLAIDLAREWGLLGRNGALSVEPDLATDAELLLVHDPGSVSYTHLTLPTIYSV